MIQKKSKPKLKKENISSIINFDKDFEKLNFLNFLCFENFSVQHQIFKILKEISTKMCHENDK